MAGDVAPLLNLAEIDGGGRALVRPGRFAAARSRLLLRPLLQNLASVLLAACRPLSCVRSPRVLRHRLPLRYRRDVAHPLGLPSAVSPRRLPSARRSACRAPCPGSVPHRRLNLAAVSPSDFQLLLSLQGREAHADYTVAAARFLHSLLASVCPPPPPASPFPQGFSLEMIVALLSKDKLNAFGLMEPVSSRDGGEVDGERSVRAYGIYPRASFFNHDCLPNACRFDYVDSASDGNTDIIVRMIHDVPQGREICLSYFPVNLNYANRQRRPMEDYGFTCGCDRCKVEANWSDDENEHGDIGEDNDGNGEGMDEDADEQMSGSEVGKAEEEETDFPHAYFFIRYMCNRKNCGGTMAPLPPSDGAPSDVMECNVCGQLRREDDEVEADGEENMDE
ncbi:hypothetical protein BT93_L0185 [Corymbia citriodora subsp. variegata]|uniref:SET domain-containing protein n=1 Tax=Corymbia citriodora subsp. variegata TaxID=360336 RepID=A0A8T0CUM7_CORYI|nr:hypothetical protein BT93_L0185 [Corymbia citriodora subsp. variegata]